MCQPLLTHSQAANTPAHQQPRKTATRTAPLPTRQPTHPLCANHRSHITHPSTLPQHNNRRKQPIHDTPPATDIPDTHQCVSHHSHITPRTTNGPTMCQPPLAHSKRPTPPNTNSLGKRPLAWHRSQPDSSPTRKCASHHWHIAHAPTLPQHNNRTKTANPWHTNSSRHLRHPQMCQPPLAHCVPDHHQPRYVPATARA